MKDVLKRYWWMILGAVFSVVIFLKFSDAPWIGKEGFWKSLFLKPIPNTYSYDICRLLEGIAISFIASIIFYFINNILPRRNREQMYQKETYCYLKKLLDDMRTPFEGMARFYTDYPLAGISFSTADMESIEKLESDVFDGLYKLCFYTKQGKARQCLEYIYDYLCKVDEDINGIMRFESYLDVPFLQTVKKLRETKYYTQYKMLYEDPVRSNYISPEESKEILREQYKFSQKRIPNAIQAIQIANIDTTSLKEWVSLYQELSAYADKKIVRLEV